MLLMLCPHASNEENGITNEAIILEWVVSSALWDFEKVMRLCTTQCKMLLFYVRKSLSEGLATWASPSEERKKKTDFGCLVTFRFGTFTMSFVPLRVFLVMNTFEDEWYIVIKAYNIYCIVGNFQNGVHFRVFHITPWDTRWMHDIVGWVWATAHAEHGPVACTWLSSQCDWTSGHRIWHKKYSLHMCTTHVYNTCTTQELQVKSSQSMLHTGWSSTCRKSYGDGMDGWKYSRQLYWHALPVAPITVARRDLSPVTGTMSQATITNSIDRLPCGYLYHSSHWIGKSMSGLCHCCCH